MTLALLGRSQFLFNTGSRERAGLELDVYPEVSLFEGLNSLLWSRCSSAEPTCHLHALRLSPR